MAGSAPAHDNIDIEDDWGFVPGESHDEGIGQQLIGLVRKLFARKPSTVTSGHLDCELSTLMDQHLEPPICMGLRQGVESGLIPGSSDIHGEYTESERTFLRKATLRD